MKTRKCEVGDKVTAKSTPAKAMLFGVPKTLELAKYPSLVGVVLTVVKITNSWIICERESGTTAPGLVAEDLEHV